LAAPARLNATKVAVLDDDEDAASSIADILSQQGFDALAFSTAESLEAAAALDQFAAFVLDWLLGDTTAATLIVKLRAVPSLANAPIFLLSGNLAVGGVPSDPDLAAAILQYRLEYRSKPYSSVRLARDLTKAMKEAES
jgi:FixJ family two-component response regulator